MELNSAFPASLLSDKNVTATNPRNCVYAKSGHPSGLLKAPEVCLACSQSGYLICESASGEYRRTMARILIVEDEEAIAEGVRRYLLFDQHKIETCGRGDTAFEMLSATMYDLVILDWELPGLSGIELLTKFRKQGGNAPVLMLTGKSSVPDKEIGLDSGADDYLAKPFDVKELGARVRALLRRPAQISGKILSCGGLELDQSLHRAVKDGAPIQLLPKEYQLLEFFMRHPNQVFSVEVLLTQLWATANEDEGSSPDAVRTTLKRLRKKVDPDQKLIKTVHGVGYFLEAAK